MATEGRLSATLPDGTAADTETGERTIGDALEDAARHWGGATALVDTRTTARAGHGLSPSCGTTRSGSRGR